MKILSQTRFLPVVFMLLSGNACETPESRNYERIERLESGAITRRVQIVNGKKEGKMTDYYPDGRLKGERWFEHDRQTGRTVLYYPGGQVMETQFYVDGLKQGGDTVWYDNGRPQFTTWFEAGKKNGYLHKWSPDGQLIFECRYANDTLVEVKGEHISRESLPERYSLDTLTQPNAQ
jgi:antitoxin component YwqK of YwqJK toxin-antitoxin module